MNGPAYRFDTQRFPAHGIDEPNSLVAITYYQQIAIKGIGECLQYTGEPYWWEVLGFIYKDRLKLPGIPGMVLEMFK